jgi:hypothetical protein
MAGMVRASLGLLGCALLLLAGGCRALGPYRPTPPVLSPTPSVLTPPDPPRTVAGNGPQPPATAQIVAAPFDPRPACLAATEILGSVSYAAGWSLVAGPTASCLHGAAAAYLVLAEATPRPKVVYAPAPVDAGLLAGEVYWVYFPAGGTLDLAANTYLPYPPVPTSGLDRNCVAATGTPAAWTVLANGSPGAPLQGRTGAQATFIYTPGQGYRAASAIPVGQAAWIWPSGSAITAYNGRRPAATPPRLCH